MAHKEGLTVGNRVVLHVWHPVKKMGFFTITRVKRSAMMVTRKSADLYTAMGAPYLRFDQLRGLDPRRFFSVFSGIKKSCVSMRCKIRSSILWGIGKPNDHNPSKLLGVPPKTARNLHVSHNGLPRSCIHPDHTWLQFEMKQRPFYVP